MIRKSLAIFLVLSWVALSAIDLLEDLHLGASPKIHAAEGSGSPGSAVENESHGVAARIDSVSPHSRNNAGFLTNNEQTKTRKKNLKIYKLHAVFVI